jgi:hypothetical protein
VKIYISGAISSDPDYKAKFAAAEVAILGKGHSVMNPAILPLGFTWSEYMTIALAMQRVCEATLFLDNWLRSPGAQIEHVEALKAHHRLYYTLDEVPNV